MDLKNFKNMDPNILVSILNTKLRDFNGDLTDLTLEYSLSEEELRNHLKNSGFKYSEKENQFRII